MSRAPIHFLLVDDDDVDVMSVRRTFKKAMLSDPLHVVSDGIHALAMLRGDVLPKERSVVMLDLNLPRMTGIEMLRILRADPALKSTVVVVLTTSGEERDRISAAGLTVAAYLVKPLTVEALTQVVATLG